MLSNNSKAFVRFYSRSNFGELAALREQSTNFADEPTYHTNLGEAHRKIDSQLDQLLSEQLSSLSTYQFLQRTKFEVSPELDQMKLLLIERLRQLVSNHSVAYDSLWVSLDNLGMRENNYDQSGAPLHQLTKEDLKVLLTNTGSILSSPMDVVEIRALFQSTSAIGRSWRRDIGNEYVSSPSVNELIKAIEDKYCSILLTGSPGSGKTCVMLAVQDALEQIAQTRSDLLPLFIQAREFADTATEQDRQAHGLPEHWVEKAARMSEDAHVVVMIDSLDVLSIAREHSAITYFLAQIDRLLLLPNITVVTACRDFDRHYDRRIAQRDWDKEVTCQPLDWCTEIAPLLGKLGIDVSTTDATTRDLICNPRELALFAELAQQRGSFNIVTSQELAQRYLAIIVQGNSALGDEAMRAIENIAAEMLKLRSLTVPSQRFTASQDIRRTLLSNKVLHQAENGQLTFGHQTLLDVLVTSGAVRQAETLSEFIQRLSPVPFVRPSIRSYVMQLVSGDRREYRKQLRTVLTGKHAFHLRRLVVETFAELPPCDDDWPLIRDLRTQNHEIFQVIYTQGKHTEWHFFWMKHLVPILRDDCDADGLMIHAHRVSQWKNDDPAGVSAYWAEVLSLESVDKSQLISSMARGIAQVDEYHLGLYVPLLVELIKLPRPQYSFLGHALAYGVKKGGLDDAILWQYIVDEISDEDVLSYNLENKLHCQPHEFGSRNDKFLATRMKESTRLLDLALTTIEKWSEIKRSRYGYAPLSYRSFFLQDTSYADVHSQNEIHHIDSKRVLLDAVETAIVHHAATQSTWWQNNRKRLCFSEEGSLRYFAILACITTPTANIDIISSILCEKTLLESDLSYEVGTLIQKTFLQLEATTQNLILSTILTLHEQTTDEPSHRVWILSKQAQLILTIPCHYRSPNAQAVLDECEKELGPIVRQPHIGHYSGIVHAPFSFEVFLETSDDGVICLLDHYSGHKKDSYDDVLTGGEREVGEQLREAASRQPSRFINLLSANWERVEEHFRDNLMEGVATYLAYRHGNLNTNNNWSPKEEPDAPTLAQQVLDELISHPNHWHHNRAASEAIKSCSYVVKQARDVERLVSLAVGFSTLQEESSVSGDSDDLLTIGLNMARGKVAEALIIVANQLDTEALPWPELLANTLHLFVRDENSAIRALILMRMPYLQSNHPELGWEMFDIAMREGGTGLWAVAEPCLYYAYRKKFEIVTSWLEFIYCEGRGKDLKVWGRISALAAFTKQLDFAIFLEDIKRVKSVEAWLGAASVWSHVGNMHKHRKECLAGLEAGLNEEAPYALAVARKLRSLFREITPLIVVPLELIQRCLSLLETEADSSRRDLFGFDAWLNATSLREPMYALEVTEVYFGYIRRSAIQVYDHEDNLTQLLTRLFAQAEELEEADDGAMLKRVVAIQDELLALGVNGMNEWLEAAERP
ncbi:AAA family ATPase [Vreelandella titanicae]|uniref:ATPase AAA-type core domain-containing protein n=1 Tax=Vreelandella titanicae TaxID=664683 RepID=A0AAP9T0K0_9GAMM|nr:AAA family ATPase [Halomonas titanicae]QKS23601.1 hypothetical protein FX987_01360 [Halomonas titanicae]